MVLRGKSGGAGVKDRSGRGKQVVEVENVLV